MHKYKIAHKESRIGRRRERGEEAKEGMELGLVEKKKGNWGKEERGCGEEEGRVGGGEREGLGGKRGEGRRRGRMRRTRGFNGSVWGRRNEIMESWRMGKQGCWLDGYLEGWEEANFGSVWREGMGRSGRVEGRGGGREGRWRKRGGLGRDGRWRKRRREEGSMEGEEEEGGRDVYSLLF